MDEKRGDVDASICKQHEGQDQDTLCDRPVRAANEDDDGYDPYSDLKRSDSLYEEDPWR